MVPYMNDVQDQEDTKVIKRLFMEYARIWYRMDVLPNTHVDGLQRILNSPTYREENKLVYEEYKEQYLITKDKMRLQEVEEKIAQSQFKLDRGVVNVAKVGSGKTFFIAMCIYRALMRKEYLTVITDNKDNVEDIKHRLKEEFGEEISGAVLYMDGMTTVNSVVESKSVIVTHHQFLTHRGFSDREYPKMTAILKDEERIKSLILVDELQNFTNIRHKDITFEYPIFQSPKASSETIFKRFPFGKIPDTYKASDGERYEQKVSISNYVKYITTEGYNSIDYNADGDLNKYNAERHDLNLMRYLEPVEDTEEKLIKQANKKGYGYIEKMYRVKVRDMPTEKELRPLFTLLQKCDEAFILEKIPTFKGEYVFYDEIDHYRGLAHFKGLWTKTLRIRDESIIREKLPKIVGFTASFEENDAIFNGYKIHHCNESFSFTQKASVMGIESGKINFEKILETGLNTLVVFDLKSQAKERYDVLKKNDTFRRKVQFLNSDGEANISATGDEDEAHDYPIKITYRDNARLRGKDLPKIECLVYDLNYSRNLLLRKTGDDILHKIRQAIGRPLRGQQDLKSFVFFNLGKEEGTLRLEGARDYIKTLVGEVFTSNIWIPRPMFEELKDTPPEKLRPISLKGNEAWGNSGRGKTIRDLYNYKYSFEIRKYLCDSLQEAQETNQLKTTEEWRELLGMGYSKAMNKPSKMWKEDTLDKLSQDGIAVNIVDNEEDFREKLIWFQDTNGKWEDSL